MNSTTQRLTTATARRLADSITKAPLASSSFRTAPTATKKLAAQLLSPVPLYRRLLRVHRKALPIEMRVMGDEYIKAEFRRTRSTDNPLHIVGFLSEWKKYLDFHEAQVAQELKGGADEEGKVREREREGQKLESELFEKAELSLKLLPKLSYHKRLVERLSADQLGQLYELLQATKEVWTPPTATEPAADGAHEGVPEGGVLPDLASAHPAKDGEGR